MLLKSEFLIKQTSMEYVVGRIIGDKEVPQMLPRIYTNIGASKGLTYLGYILVLLHCLNKTLKTKTLNQG